LDNHLRVAKVHIGFVIFYIIFYISLTFDHFQRPLMPIGNAHELLISTLLVCTLHLLIARGAQKKKRWARIVSILIACLLLIAVPIGTMIGIYLLKYNRWAKDDSGSLNTDKPLSEPHLNA